VVGGGIRDPCPLGVKTLLRIGIDWTLGNCSLPTDNDTLPVGPINCTDRCFAMLLFIQRAIHDCRDDYRFIDEIFHPLNRLRFALVNDGCELRRRVANAFECRAAVNRTVAQLRMDCPANITVCTDNCRMSLKNGLALLGVCNSFFRDIATVVGVDFGDAIVDFTRRIRYLCDVTAKTVEVNVTSDTLVIITSEDSLSPNRSRTFLEIFVNDTLEWGGGRFDNYNDTKPEYRFRFRVKRLHEFRPRNGSDSDPDFQLYGVDPLVDIIVQSFDFTNASDTDIDPITDLGSVDIYDNTNGTGPMPNNGTGPVPGPNNGTNLPSNSDTPSWRRVIRASLRFGDGRLGRLVVTFVATNIKNQIDDGEVSIPGGVSFNLLIDNIPYRFNDTSVALEIEVDTDDDSGELVPNTTSIDTDAMDTSMGDTFSLQDNTEGQVQYGNDTRRIRWKRRVFCDGNKTVVIRSRFVKSVNETPDGGFIVRKRLFITFHIASGDRCSRFLWDPATDIETPVDSSPAAPTDTTATGTATTSSETGTGTGTGTSSGTHSGSAILFASFVMIIFALMF